MSPVVPGKEGVTQGMKHIAQPQRQRGAKCISTSYSGWGVSGEEICASVGLMNYDIMYRIGLTEITIHMVNIERDLS